MDKKISDSGVLEMAGIERSIPDTNKKWKTGYFGHVLRGPKYELIKLIIQGKIEGVHRGPGREKIQELMRVAEEQENWNNAE